MRRIMLGLLLAGALPSVATAQSAPASLIDRAAGSRAKGVENAPVTVYEIADFQCPHCARFALDVFPQIDSAFVKTGRVQWVFVNLPMPNHGNAWVASEAALCAGAVADRFWPVHDRLFAGTREWSAAPAPGEILERYARESGVPLEAWRECVAGDRVAPLILQDVIFGSRVSGTPTFIINNERTVVGVKPFAEWKALLEEAIANRKR